MLEANFFIELKITRLDAHTDKTGVKKLVYDVLSVEAIDAIHFGSLVKDLDLSITSSLQLLCLLSTSGCSNPWYSFFTSILRCEVGLGNREL